MRRLCWLLPLLLLAPGCASTPDDDGAGDGATPEAERELEDVVLHFISNSGQPSLKPGAYVVASRAAFAKARRENPNLPEKLLPVPEGIDFGAVRLAIVAPELSSGSARLKFKGVRVGPTGYTVRYRIDAPPGAGTADMAYPALLVELPRDEKPVTFQKLE